MFVYKTKKGGRSQGCLSAMLNSYVAAVFKQTQWENGGRARERQTEKRGGRPAERAVSRTARRRRGSPPLIFQLIW